MCDKKIYYTRAEAINILGIHYHTIRNLRLEGKIETIKVGKRNLYNVKKYLKDNVINNNILNEEQELDNSINIRKKICYCRVSSHGQKKELDNQIEFMKSKYPDYELLSDIGSGINFKRKNLLKIIDYAVNNELEEIVIAYKDRLCRIAYELLEFLFTKYSNTKITIINNDENKSPEKEVTDDLIQIITCFSSRLYGMRNYIQDINEGEKKS